MGSYDLTSLGRAVAHREQQCLRCLNYNLNRLGSQAFLRNSYFHILRVGQRGVAVGEKRWRGKYLNLSPHPISHPTYELHFLYSDLRV